MQLFKNKDIIKKWEKLTEMLKISLDQKYKSEKDTELYLRHYSAGIEGNYVLRLTFYLKNFKKMTEEEFNDLFCPVFNFNPDTMTICEALYPDKKTQSFIALLNDYRYDDYSDDFRNLIETLRNAISRRVIVESTFNSITVDKDAVLTNLDSENLAKIEGFLTPNLYVSDIKNFYLE